jgi:Arc/MetJ-type ribon-helix-helix transcriptional regulator
MVARMARKQVLVQLDDAQIAQLDRLIAGGEDNRSGLIRRAIDLYLDAVAEGLADVRYAEGYRRIPEDLDEHAGLRALALEAWPDR